MKAYKLIKVLPKNPTIRDVDKFVSGFVEKTVWSMLKLRKELDIVDVIRKGYNQNEAVKFLNDFIDLGIIEKVDGKFKIKIGVK